LSKLFPDEITSITVEITSNVVQTTSPAIEAIPMRGEMLSKTSETILRVLHQGET